MNDNRYLHFTPGVIPPEEKHGEDLWFAFYENKLLVKPGESGLSIPIGADLKNLGLKIVRSHYLGSLDGQDCYSAELAERPGRNGFELKDLRPLMGVMEYNIALAAGRALQINEWDRNHIYCSRCGALNEIKEGERAKVCPECGLLSYPVISPAIIVAVVRKDTLLLANNKNFPKNRYSVIAGFVEPGETFEECVMREVQEETSIRIKNIKYFGSQPWPFPHSMMIGFTAEYEGGEIQVDGVEIGDAAWFKADALPEIPPKGSISRELIEWFVENNR